MPITKEMLTQYKRLLVSAVNRDACFQYTDIGYTDALKAQYKLREFEKVLFANVEAS